MLEGQKVNLQLIESEDDIQKIYSTYNNLRERTQTDHTEIYAVNNILKRYRENGLWSKDSGMLKIVTKEQKLVGTISFSRKSEFELALGYRIFKTEDRNQGYMTEVLTLFSSYLFQTIPLITRLALYTAENNIPSRKLAERCGYTLEGSLRNAYFYRGKICNWMIYSILREEI